MKKFMFVVLMALTFVSSGWAQNKTKVKKSTTTSPSKDTTKQTVVSKPTSKYDTQLIAVVTLKKDTLFFSESEPICKTIKEMWDMNSYPDRPVILFVSNEQLYSVYNRVHNVKSPIKN